MFLVELVMQGVRGFRELARLRFQNGFNFVAAGNEAGKTTAVDTIQRLLFPSNQPGLIDSLVSRHVPDASRSALVLFSDDGGYYRVIQDFSKRAINLSKHNAETKDFNLLHKDWNTTASFLSGVTSGMSEADFSKVFIFRRDHYAAPAGTSAPAPAQIPRIQPSKPVASSSGQTPANQAKLAELREMLKKAEAAADAEYRAQSAKIALDETRKKLNLFEEMDLKKKEIDSTLAELKACETLPENLNELIEAHEQRFGQKMAESDALITEINGLKMQIEEIPPVNFVTDKLFILGVALGVLSFVAGVFVLNADQTLYFLFGILVATGLMAAAWYNGSRKNTQRETILREIAGLEKERVDLDKRFGQDGATINSFMRQVGTTTLAALKDKAENYRYFLSQYEDFEEQRKRILGERTLDSLEQEYHKQQQEALDLEKAARAVAKDNIDTYSIRQDIERLETASTPDIGWDFGGDVQAFSSGVGATPPGGRSGGFHAELAIASRIGEIEMETLVPAVEAAAQRNLFSITDGRYVKIEVGHEGVPVTVHAKDNTVVDYSELSHGTRDLVYFCLRTGLVEAISGKRLQPFILDDPLAGFDSARQKAAGHILRVLAKKTQVILFSSNSALKAEGDAAAELK